MRHPVVFALNPEFSLKFDFRFHKNLVRLNPLSASVRASVSTTGPLETLTRTADFFILASSLLPMRPVVSSVSWGSIQLNFNRLSNMIFTYGVAIRSISCFSVLFVVHVHVVVP